MRPGEPIHDFVREALSRGRPRAEVGAALTGAGWAEAEVAEALAAWGDGGALPPVPRPRPTVSPREGFAYGLLFVTLAVTAWSLTALAFSVIDAVVPDVAATDAYGNADYYARSGTRWSTAALIVFTPVTLWMGRRVEREAAANAGKRRSPVRQGLGNLALLLVTLVLLGDVLALVYAWLSGDLSARFALKVGATAVIAGAVFLYVRALTREEEAAPGPGGVSGGISGTADAR